MHKCPTCGSDLLFAITALTPVGDAYGRWVNHLEATGLSYAYISKLRSILRRYIRPILGDVDISAISSQRVFNFYSTLLQRGLAGKTIKHVLDALKGLLIHHHRLDVIPALPKFPRVKVICRPKKWISIVTQNSILDNIPPPLQLIFRILFESGMRPGEARALKRRDIEGSLITVERSLDEGNNIRPTKTGKIYKYKISDALGIYIAANYSDYLPEANMFNALGGYLSRSGLQRVWVRACAAVGVSIPMYQACRHSKASQISAQCEIDRLKQLQDALQHEHVATTLRFYTLTAEARI